MRYKMLVLDIDGTLVDHENKLQDYTKTMITSIKDDVKVVIASARGYYAIKPLLIELGLDEDDQYVIAFNGSLITTGQGNVLFDQCLDKASIKTLLAFIKSTDIPLKVYLYHDEGRDDVEKIDVDRYLDEYKIYKVVADGKSEDILRVKMMMDDDIKARFEITSSLLTRFEAVRNGFTKVSAIKKLSKHLNIRQDEIVAVGDGENDIAMIEYAGVGVAMANSQKEVLKSADMITKDNDHDGVGEVIDILFY